ncbi:hypothetical protein MLD38_017482 [Melastoma candidum]|uniref:Uncharacterized protein n=1 Tax=Melastoma candidum TaxID=119954 RepID=A0ACB9QS38_9MYRT|nr:hypothetical protein MLD38_017482 [Melastoma candidum]
MTSVIGKLFVVAVAFCMIGVIEGVDVPDMRFVYGICNNKTYEENSSFDRTLRDVLYQVKENTAYNKYDYYNESPWPGPSPIGYGHGRCNSQIRYGYCSECLRVAASQILRDCSMRVGAQLQLVDCRIRYEQYEFGET